MTFIIVQKETFLNQVLKMGGNGAFSESNPQKYMIYVYKDYVVLGNADINKPSIISGKYFLYNGGKKSDG